MHMPTTAPLIDAKHIFFEGMGVNAPDMPSKKSITSAAIEKNRRNNRILMPTRSKPVKAAYASTSAKMTTVPGKPTRDKYMPANNSKIKTVKPAEANGDNLLFPRHFGQPHLLKKQNAGAGYVDRRIGADNCADEQGEGKIPDNCAAENVQGQKGEKNGQRG